jgi:hypothetical protein
MKHSNIATIAAIMSFTCAGFSPAQTTYPHGRPSATLRMEAKDQGVVLKHGDGPGQCDYLGAPEALIFEENGVYHLFYDAPGGFPASQQGNGMKRDIGLAWLELPLSPPNQESTNSNP